MKRHPWILSFMALAGVVLWLTVNRLASDVPPPSPLHDLDIREYFFPNLEYIRRTLLSGSLPLWNPDQLAGYPFAATLQSALYYPLLTPLLIFPASVALSIHAVLHLWLAGALTWCLARRLGFGRQAALGAGLVYMLSAPVLHAVFNTAMLSSSIWLPAVLWALHRCSRRPTGRNAGLLAVIGSLSFLAGHPQIFLYTAQMGAAYAAFLFAFEVPAMCRRYYARALASAALTSLLLVSIQLVPTLELVKHAVRNFAAAAPSDFGFAGLQSVPLFSLTPGGSAVGLSRLFLPLVALGLTVRLRRSQLVFFAAAFVLVLDLMRGADGFGFGFYSTLPLVSLFRIPSKLAFVASLCGSLLVGAGMQRLSTLDRMPRGLRRMSSLLLLAALTFDGYTLNAPGFQYAPLAVPESLYAPNQLAAFAAARNDHQRFFPENFYQVPGVPRGTAQAGEAPQLDAYEPLLPSDYADIFGVPKGTIWTGHLTLLDVHNLDLQRKYRQQSLALLDLFGVRYYVDPKSAYGEPNGRLAAKLANEQVVQTEPFLIWERSAARPRAYVVHRAVFSPSLDDAIRRARGGDFDPTTEVVLISPSVQLREDTSAPPGSLSDAVRVDATDANSIFLSSRTQTDGRLVLADLFFPGWKARVDGGPVRIQRANGLLRAIDLPAGSHRVDFLYRPASFSLGCLLSAAGFGCLLFLSRRRSG